jgi:hypothetical protein
MTKPVATLMVGLLVISLTGCSLAAYPIPEVPMIPSPSVADREACDRAAYADGESRPFITSPWLVIPEALFWPISEVVFLPLMVAKSKDPNESDRAKIEKWKQPYIKCLNAKGYKAQ